MEKWSGKVKRYKSFVENNRRLAQEANAFGNEALGGEQQGMKGKGWRDGAIRMQGLKEGEEEKRWKEEMLQCQRQTETEQREETLCST